MHDWAIYFDLRIVSLVIYFLLWSNIQHFDSSQCLCSIWSQSILGNHDTLIKQKILVVSRKWENHLSGSPGTKSDRWRVISILDIVQCWKKAIGLKWYPMKKHYKRLFLFSFYNQCGFQTNSTNFCFCFRDLKYHYNLWKDAVSSCTVDILILHISIGCDSKFNCYFGCS